MCFFCFVDSVFKVFFYFVCLVGYGFFDGVIYSVFFVCLNRCVRVDECIGFSINNGFFGFDVGGEIRVSFCYFYYLV